MRPTTALLASFLLAASGCCFTPSETGATSSSSASSSSSSGGTTGGCAYPSAAELTAGTASWRNQCDAGGCTDDSQCASGYFCDFTVAVCSAAQPYTFGSIAPGTCRVSYYATPGTACTVGEDCGQGLCLAHPPEGGETCTLASPCASGAACGSSTSDPPPTCPTDCPWIYIPYTTDFACICADGSCDGG